MVFGSFDKFDTGKGVNGLIGEIFGAGLLDDRIDELAKDDPDVLEALLDKVGEASRDYIGETGEIDRDALKKKLSISKKMTILVGHWVDNLFGGYVDDKLSDVTQVDLPTFEEELTRLSAEENGVQIDGKNIIFPSGSALAALGSIYSFLKLLSKSKDAAENGEEMHIPTHGRIVMGKESSEDGGLMGSKFAKAKKLLEKYGVKLTLLVPGEALSEPGQKEIQFVSAPEHGLPMSADGSSVDEKTLRWYQTMFEDEIGTTWFVSSHVLVGVYMMQGLDKEKALTKAGVNRPGDEFVAQVDKLDGQLRPGAAPAAPAAPTPPSAASAAPAAPESPAAPPA